MKEDDVKLGYFYWLCDEVDISIKVYEKLMSYLFHTDFRIGLAEDENRIADGLDLRRRFAVTRQAHPNTFGLVRRSLDGPCNILEMMVALAIRCESEIMKDEMEGNRTGIWFKDMLRSLGLYAMTNEEFNKFNVEDVLTTFLYRDYMPDGSGGLFTIKDCVVDLRTVEIWYQMCWYLAGV